MDAGMLVLIGFLVMVVMLISQHNTIELLKKELQQALTQNKNLLDQLRCYKERDSEEQKAEEAQLRAKEEQERKEQLQARQTQAEYATTQSHSCDALPPLGEEQKALLRAMRGGGNFFIQGQAGTGKSTLISHLLMWAKQRHAAVQIAAPTGLAALNVGGMTIHSLFRLPPKNFFDMASVRLTDSAAHMLRTTNTLIIDEISMVRPDMLDIIDRLARTAKRNAQPFGGLQVILLGDVLQLPPVIIKTVQDAFKSEYGYKEAFFFDAPAFIHGGFRPVILKKIYRQADDSSMIEALNAIRSGQQIQEALLYFNNLKITDKDIFEKAVKLTGTRAQAEYINNAMITRLSGEAINYKSRISGSFTKNKGDEDKRYPAPLLLRLKVGALVIVLKNLTRECVNGSSAVVTALHENAVTIRLLDSDASMTITRHTWTEQGYNKRGELVETGSFEQFPLQPGYAMTVHKAQGKTLSKAVINIPNAFAHGQAYVALSRVRKSSDLHVGTELQEKDVIINQRVLSFLQDCEATA